MLHWLTQVLCSWTLGKTVQLHHWGFDFSYNNILFVYLSVAKFIKVIISSWGKPLCQSFILKLCVCFIVRYLFLVYSYALLMTTLAFKGSVHITLSWLKMTKGSAWVCKLSGYGLEEQHPPPPPAASTSFCNPKNKHHRRAERLQPPGGATEGAWCNMSWVNNNNNSSINSPRCCTHLHRRCRKPVADEPGRSCTLPRAHPPATAPAARACRGRR